MLIYLTPCSVDGYLQGPGGDYGWAEPDEEVHAFFNDVLRPIGTCLYGRRMYETMAVWETDPSFATENAVMADFAAIWQAVEKVVYSRTLDEPVTARTRIEREFDPATVHAMKTASAANLTIGGAELAGQAISARIVDEIHLVVFPAVLGGGAPVLPAGVGLDLELVEQRTFVASGVVSLRYRVRT